MADIQRKLASVQRIKALLPIEGADKIELALVQGWQVVVKKGEYKVGDLVIYLEIDSWVPHAIAPFLTDAGKEPKEFNGVKGERLKTIKLRKQLSQGLILPLITLTDQLAGLVSEGEDVTQTIGIQKWEPAEKEHSNQPMGAKTRSFPYFLRKTDQERAQNYEHMILQNLDTEFETTVKKDGSSCTVFRVDPSSPYYEDAKLMVEGKPTFWQRVKEFIQCKPKAPVVGICSRNCLLTAEGDSNFHRAAAEAMEVLRNDSSLAFNKESIAIQGEVVAPDIQGNYEKVSRPEFHIFDIFDIEKQEYVLPFKRKFFADTRMLDHISIVDKGTLRNILQLKEGEDVVQKLLTYAEGEGDNPGVMREGVVMKAMTKDFSFKVVSNSYLLRKG